MTRSSIAALALLALTATAHPAAAQAAPDSITAWTARLQSGTLEMRVDAAGKLAAQDPASLPAPTRSALIAELQRVNGSLLATGTVEGASNLGGETFAEYYLDLVIPVSHFRTVAAAQVLVHSVGVGRGVQRRVARHGDAIVPELAAMVKSGHEAGDALETLALAWFWADSTRTALSTSSQIAVVDAFLMATTAEDYSLLRASADALLLTGDPALLPVAEVLEIRALNAGQSLLASALRRNTIPGLRAMANRATPAQLAARVSRTIGVACLAAGPGEGRAACTAAQAHVASAQRDLAGGRASAARANLRAAVAQADRARAERTLTPGEHALVAGGARMVLDRL
jgi:hypothetical protein